MAVAHAPIVASTATAGRFDLVKRKYFDATLAGTVRDVFAALSRTLAFRRWPGITGEDTGQLPVAGSRYRFKSGSVLRLGRVVEVIRPVAVTLKEVLHDPPCRVGLTLRWRIDSLSGGSVVRLLAEYRLNHAAALRARHWDHRLSLHFGKQFEYVAKNLKALRDCQPSIMAGGKEM
jgi:hypothetical protein